MLALTLSACGKQDTPTPTENAELSALIEAAENGDVDAQVKLGDAYLYAKSPVDTADYAEALKWYSAAAEKGDMRAQNMVGFMYLKGFGVEQDYGDAIKWYQLAAEQGLAQAQWKLGYIYYLNQQVTAFPRRSTYS